MKDPVSFSGPRHAWCRLEVRTRDNPVFLLTAAELRRTFLVEGGDAFLHVEAVGMQAARDELSPKRNLFRLFQAVIDQRLHSAEAERTLVGEVVEETAARWVGFSVWHNIVKQPGRDEVSGWKEFAGKKQKFSPCRAD